MRWPLMSVRVHERCIASYHTDLNAAIFRAELAEKRADVAVKRAEARYDALLEKYHALRLAGANAPEPSTLAADDIAIDFPPAQVIAAMRRISPSRDKTFDANWAYWERNKAHAAAHPDAFADEILRGVEHDRTVQE